MYFLWYVIVLVPQRKKKHYAWLDKNYTSFKGGTSDQNICPGLWSCDTCNRPGKYTWAPAPRFQAPGMNSPSGKPECQCKQRRAAHFDTFHDAFHDLSGHNE